MNDLRSMIDYLAKTGHKPLETIEAGYTGYLDIFKPVSEEKNGYGYDSTGRAFVQLKVLIEGKEEILRVFERYTDNNLLVYAGTGKADEIFSSELEPEEWDAFVGLVVDGKGFKQFDTYYKPITVEPA